MIKQKKLKEFLDRIEKKNEDSDLESSLYTSMNRPPADRLFLNLFNVYAKNSV